MPNAGIFADIRGETYPYRHEVTFLVHKLIGGVPSDERKIEGWLRSKVEASDQTIREMVREAAQARQAKTAAAAAEDAAPVDTISKEDVDKALLDVALKTHLNGFKRDPETGILYIEGRQLKAAIKEAANIRWPGPKDTWGPTKKRTKGFFAEHVFVEEERLFLGLTEPSGIQQRFVHTRFGSSIVYEEYVDEAEFTATIVTDYPFEDKQWGQLWVTGEMQGIGASRSQGFGRYVVIDWRQL